MWSASRLLTPKEQGILLLVALAILTGAAVLTWSARSRSEQAILIPEKAPSSPVPAQETPPVPPVPKEHPAPALPAAVMEPPAAPLVAVAVRGGIRKEGLYRMAADSRVADLIMQAGGATTEADISALNLAARLVDGTTLIVPVRSRIEQSDARTFKGRGPTHGAEENLAIYQMNPASQGGAVPAGYREYPPGSAGTTALPAGDVLPATPAAPADKHINLNTATQAELESLPGIGPVLAERIVSYRATQPFQSVDDLNNVSGIGAKKLEGIRDLVTAP